MYENLLSPQGTVIWNAVTLDPFLRALEAEYCSGKRSEVSLMSVLSKRQSLKRLFRHIRELFGLLLNCSSDDIPPDGYFDLVTDRTNGLDQLPGRFAIAGALLDGTIWSLFSVFEALRERSADNSALVVALGWSVKFDNGDLVRFFGTTADDIRRSFDRIFAELRRQCPFDPDTDMFRPVPSDLLNLISSQFTFFDASIFVKPTNQA